MGWVPQQFEFFFFSGVLGIILFPSLMQMCSKCTSPNSEGMNRLSSEARDCGQGPPAWLRVRPRAPR